MSFTYPAGILSKTPVTPAGPYAEGAASGVWKLNEIAYWVELDYRHTTVGYRLLKEYCKLCEEMKLEERIHFFTMSQMEGQELNYERFGFRPIEHTWSQ